MPRLGSGLVTRCRRLLLAQNDAAAVADDVSSGVERKSYSRLRFYQNSRLGRTGLFGSFLLAQTNKKLPYPARAI